jgi:hypothetical protein
MMKVVTLFGKVVVANDGHDVIFEQPERIVDARA